MDNLSAIKEKSALQEQKNVFKSLEENLESVDRQTLQPAERIEYDLLSYQLKLHSERIILENQWLAENRDSISDGGIYHLPNGAAWYAYFLKQWIDVEVNPDSLFAFGISEIENVLREMRLLQQRSGLDSTSFQDYIQQEPFFYTDVASVHAAFEAYSMDLMEKLPDYFPETDKIRKLSIKEGTDKRLAQVPGFYRNNTFYYNFFDRPFNKRQIAWLYLHEALPGHHYQICYSQLLDQSSTQELFYFPAYSEGWAAYVEAIGRDIGAYPTIYDELGKWEWDIIRSVRVPLDIGLNYYGWSDTKALEFWQKYIQGKDDIALREIARMKRWPCQVITYKYGANKILEWKAEFQKKPGFDLKTFHTRFLEIGPLPFSILEEVLFE